MPLQIFKFNVLLTQSKLENYLDPYPRLDLSILEDGVGVLKCSLGLYAQFLFEHEGHKYQVYDSEDYHGLKNTHVSRTHSLQQSEEINLHQQYDIPQQYMQLPHPTCMGGRGSSGQYQGG